MPKANESISWTRENMLKTKTFTTYTEMGGFVVVSCISNTRYPRTLVFLNRSRASFGSVVSQFDDPASSVALRSRIRVGLVISSLKRASSSEYRRCFYVLMALMIFFCACWTSGLYIEFCSLTSTTIPVIILDELAYSPKLPS